MRNTLQIIFVIKSIKNIRESAIFGIFREYKFSRIREIQIFREYKFSRIRDVQIVREDLISRIWSKFANFAKINPLKVVFRDPHENVNEFQFGLYHFTQQIIYLKAHLSKGDCGTEFQCEESG